MPPKAKGKGRKAGAGVKKKNSSPGESQCVKAGAPACPHPQYTQGSSGGIQLPGQQDGVGLFWFCLFFL